VGIGGLGLAHAAQTNLGGGRVCGREVGKREEGSRKVRSRRDLPKNRALEGKWDGTRQGVDGKEDHHPRTVRPPVPSRRRRARARKVSRVSAFTSRASRPASSSMAR